MPKPITDQNRIEATVAYLNRLERDQQKLARLDVTPAENFKPVCHGKCVTVLMPCGRWQSYTVMTEKEGLELDVNPLEFEGQKSGYYYWMIKAWLKI
jgi:hypothetical protein